MDGDELRAQANTIDVSEKDTNMRVSRKIDLMVFCMADLVDTVKTNSCDIDEMKKEKAAAKNKIIGAVSFAGFIGGFIGWIIEKFVK